MLKSLDYILPPMGLSSFSVVMGSESYRKTSQRKAALKHIKMLQCLSKFSVLPVLLFSYAVLFVLVTTEIKVCFLQLKIEEKDSGKISRTRTKQTRE